MSNILQIRLWLLLHFLTERVYNRMEYIGSAVPEGSMGCNRSGSVGRALDWGSASCPTKGCDSLSTNETFAGEDGGSKGCYIHEVRVSPLAESLRCVFEKSTLSAAAQEDSYQH